MSKFLGVAALWICLISLPHVSGPVADGTLIGASSTLALLGEDPGDPFLLAAMPTAAPEGPPARAPAAGTHTFATIHFKNELGKSYTLVEARVVLDNKPLPVVTDLATNAEVALFTGRVSPGPHVVKANVLCRGNDRGPFTYMKKYTVNVAGEQIMTVPEDRTVLFTVAAHRNTGMNVPFEKQVEITAVAAVLPEGGNALHN